MMFGDAGIDTMQGNDGLDVMDAALTVTTCAATNSPTSFMAVR